jgi:hypothetical protein
MNLPPKAQSVTKAGNPDSFLPPMAFDKQVLEGGYTRLEISSPSDRLNIIHQALVAALSPPLKMRFVRMASREKGQLAKPESYVGVELSNERVLQACKSFKSLLYHDGRCQLWILGAKQEQLVLDDIGMMYLYPDDPSFQDILKDFGWRDMPHQSMASRDYVKVNFLKEADEQEQSLIQSLGLVMWDN